VSRRGRIAVALAALATGLVLPGSASAHAYLVKTVPAASVIVNTPPPAVALTFDEAVEPRFALISVTDVQAQQETSAALHRSAANPDTLVVPLKRLPEGWYLVYWRAISVDGHPVQGAFTFAVGPSPGPAPQFMVPHVSQTATTTPLLLARWAVFLTVMGAIGLFVLRMLIARPLVRRVEGTSLRVLSLGFLVASVPGLVALPVYLEESTAVDSVRSFFAVGALVPLWRTTAFGRGYLKMELCFALFCVAAWIALSVDRPQLPRRSIAALFALSGALAAAAAVLVFPGAAGHAAQTSPRGVTVLLDWLHLVAGSVWLGGLLGLLVLWLSLPAARRVAGLIVSVPRFSTVAFVSVLLLLGTGIGETVVHLLVELLRARPVVQLSRRLRVCARRRSGVGRCLTDRREPKIKSTRVRERDLLHDGVGRYLGVRRARRAGRRSRSRLRLGRCSASLADANRDPRAALAAAGLAFSDERVGRPLGEPHLRPARGPSRARRAVATWCLAARSRRRPASCRPCGAGGAAACRSGSHRPTGEARSTRCSGRDPSSSAGTRTAPGARYRGPARARPRRPSG
jgi:methionine-rich copper-binding protein CopC/putative copper export protein